ncbi:MAG: hypothetical protein ABH823_00410 [bacterium]
MNANVSVRGLNLHKVTRRALGRPLVIAEATAVAYADRVFQSTKRLLERQSGHFTGLARNINSEILLTVLRSVPLGLELDGLGDLFVPRQSGQTSDLICVNDVIEEAIGLFNDGKITGAKRKLSGLSDAVLFDRKGKEIAKKLFGVSRAGKAQDRIAKVVDQVTTAIEKREGEVKGDVNDIQKQVREACRAQDFQRLRSLLEGYAAEWTMSVEKLAPSVGKIKTGDMLNEAMSCSVAALEIIQAAHATGFDVGRVNEFLDRAAQSLNEYYAAIQQPSGQRDFVSLSQLSVEEHEKQSGLSKERQLAEESMWNRVFDLLQENDLRNLEVEVGSELTEFLVGKTGSSEGKKLKVIAALAKAGQSDQAQLAALLMALRNTKRRDYIVDGEYRPDFFEARRILAQAEVARSLMQTNDLAAFSQVVEALPGIVLEASDEDEIGTSTLICRRSEITARAIRMVYTPVVKKAATILAVRQESGSSAQAVTGLADLMDRVAIFLSNIRPAGQSRQVHEALDRLLETMSRSLATLTDEALGVEIPAQSIALGQLRGAAACVKTQKHVEPIDVEVGDLAAWRDQRDDQYMIFVSELQARASDLRETVTP